MSSRRKGKPQQRKDIDTLEPEPEPDHLTCGECQQDFQLGDIVHFIQHKVLRCETEKVASDSCVNPEDDQSPDQEGLPSESKAVICSHRTSISAPISQRRQTSELRDKSKSQSSEVETSEMTEDDRHEKGDEDSVRPPPSVAMEMPEAARPQCIDAEANTVRTEPTKFTCGTCKQQHESAWALLQHAQNDHGLHIYIDEQSCTPKHTSPAHSVETSPEALVKKADSLYSSSPEKFSPPARIFPARIAENGHADSMNNNVKRESGDENEEPEPGQISSVSPASSHSSRTPISMPGSGVPPLRLNTTPPSAMDMMSPPSPFLFRMPMGERHHLPTHPALHPPHSAFPRPPHLGDFRLEFMSEHFHRMQAMGMAGAAGMEGARPFPSPFDRHPIRPPVTPIPPLGPIPPTPNSDTGLDFYSQQLRRLAGTNATSPGMSPLRKLAPGFPTSNTTPPAALLHTSPPLASTPADVERSPLCSPRSPICSPRGSHPTSPDSKACEICGKRFRFHSNLMVHRRSHSGMRPFRCPLCSLTCSKATRLRRHLKTHSMRPGLSSVSSSVSTSSEQSFRSGNSSPESKVSKMDPDEMLDSDDESDEEAAMEEARRMGAVVDEPTDLSNHDRLSEHERSHNSDSDEEKKSPEAKKIKVEMNGDEPAAQVKEAGPRDLTVVKREDRASLLSEVMEHSGLGNIQQYSEAFRAALAESSRTRKVEKQEEEEEEDKKEKENTTVSPPASPQTNGVSRCESNGSVEISDAGQSDNSRLSSASQEAEGPEHFSKRMKLDSKESSPYPPTLHESFIPRFWFPGAPHHPPDFHPLMRSMFPSEHFGVPFQNSENGLHHPEGLRLDHKTSGSPMNPLAPVSASCSPSTPTGLPMLRKESRRNDTCEFCGKIFKNCSNLTVHRRSHTGEKPYKCGLCSYACAQSSKLTRHMKTHGRTGKDVYHCKFCNMPFSVPSTLEKHMRKCVEMQPGRVPAALAAAAMAAVNSSPLGQIPHPNHGLASSASSI